MSLNASHLVPRGLPVSHQIDSQHAPQVYPFFVRVSRTRRPESAGIGDPAAYMQLSRRELGYNTATVLRAARATKEALIGDYRILWR
jgi:hypothetical protein